MTIKIDTLGVLKINEVKFRQIIRHFISHWMSADFTMNPLII